MKSQWIIILITLMAVMSDMADAKAKYKKSKSKSKSKKKTKFKFKFSGGGGDYDDYGNNDYYDDDHIKYKIDDDYDRNYVGCEPWKFTFLMY